MIPQTVLRVYHLIQLLIKKPYYDKKRLAAILQVSTKTVGRYFELLENIGYAIEKNFQGEHFIAMETYPAEQGVKFTWQEIELLGQLLQTDAARHTLRGDILKKLFIPKEFHPLADQYLNSGHAPKIEQLAQAITQQKRVVLISYGSNHSKTVKDRIVEPLQLSEDYQMLSAHEPGSGIPQKQFKIERMEGVEILPDPITYRGAVNQADFFGFIGSPFVVQLHLNMQAFQLLTAEFPATQPFIRTNPQEIPDFRPDYPYYFEAQVCDQKGIGRFLLGIPGDAIVATPQSLKDYLNERMEWRF